MEDALCIDKESGDTRWANAINKEMGKVRVAFQILANGEKAPFGFERIGCHLIFDVKMENFQFKGRMVGNSNETGNPASLTYVLVVSRKSIWIALTLAGLKMTYNKSKHVISRMPTSRHLPQRNYSQNSDQSLVLMQVKLAL